MNVSDERTVSLWATVKAAPDAVPLMENDQADVIVIGAGIAGLSVAYEFAVCGQKVAVIDRNRQRDDRADNRSPFIDMR